MRAMSYEQPGQGSEGSCALECLAWQLCVCVCVCVCLPDCLPACSQSVSSVLQHLQRRLAHSGVNLREKVFAGAGPKPRGAVVPTSPPRSLRSALVGLNERRGDVEAVNVAAARLEARPLAGAPEGGHEVAQVLHKAVREACALRCLVCWVCVPACLRACLPARLPVCLSSDCVLSVTKEIGPQWCKPLRKFISEAGPNPR